MKDSNPIPMRAKSSRIRHDRLACARRLIAPVQTGYGREIPLWAHRVKVAREVHRAILPNGYSRKPSPRNPSFRKLGM